MFVELPQELILMTVGAFVLGWILSSISSFIGRKAQAKKRDPRDDRIRQLEAELRIAQTDVTKTKEILEIAEKARDDALEGVEKRDNVISHQQTKIDEVKKDLQDSVRKTRELRSELSERATENVRSEAKLREVETELSIAQASTDLIATGVLDYALDSESKDDHDDLDKLADIGKTAP